MREGKLVVVDHIQFEGIKTKQVVQLMKDLGLKSALFLIPEEDTVFEKSARNLHNVRVLRVEGANVYDILRYEHLVLTQAVVELLASRVE